MAGTTPKSRALGAELRKAREAAGLTVRGLASLLEISHATVSRWETGDRLVQPENVSAYLVACKAPAEVRDELVEMSRYTESARWLSMGMPDLKLQLAALLEIEANAKVITNVAPLLVPGLLQTGEYVFAVMQEGGVPPSEIHTRVATRIGRQHSITRRRNPVELRAYIGEAVLRGGIGGDEVMGDQLDALLEFGQLPNVEIRVIPTNGPWHVGLEGMFTYTESEDGTPIVHLETRVSGLFLHEPDDVRAYKDALPRLAEVAMSSADSAALIAEVSSDVRRRLHEGN
ncbi:helix-turn-helix domain-containing protein [Amycolatopsis sp. NPDC004368]